MKLFALFHFKTPSCPLVTLCDLGKQFSLLLTSISQIICSCCTLKVSLILEILQFLAFRNPYMVQWLWLTRWDLSLPQICIPYFSKCGNEVLSETVTEWNQNLVLSGWGSIENTAFVIRILKIKPVLSWKTGSSLKFHLDCLPFQVSHFIASCIGF